MFVMLLGSFTYAQTDRETILDHVQTLTSTNTTITHSDDTLYAGDVFTISNGIDSSVHRPALGSPNFTLYGYVENLQGYYLTTFYSTIQNLVNNLQASYSRADELENLGDGTVTVSVEILWPDTTYSATKISIFNGETLMWDTVVNSLLDALDIAVYENHLTNITNLVNDQLLLNERANILISIVEAHSPILFDIVAGDFTVNIGADGTTETAVSWGIGYSFYVPGIVDPFVSTPLTAYGITKDETDPSFSLIFLSSDQFDSFVSELTDQTSGFAVYADVFDFGCN